MTLLGARLIAAISAFVWLTATSHASIFPNLAIGDPFAGVIQLDASTPRCQYPTCDGPSNFFAYESSAGIGDLAMILGGVPVTSTIALVMGFTGNDASWRWFSQTNGNVNFNGTDLGKYSYITLILYGTSNSTSILPLDLDAYNAAPNSSYFLGPNIQMQLISPDGLTGAAYSGPLTSLTRIGSSDLFSFSGVIGETTIYNIPGPTPAVPEPSTWAMRLIGFAVLAVAGRRCCHVIPAIVDMREFSPTRLRRLWPLGGFNAVQFGSNRGAKPCLPCLDLAALAMDPDANFSHISSAPASRP